MDGVWLDAISRNFICFWPSRLSGLEEQKTPRSKTFLFLPFSHWVEHLVLVFFSVLTDFNSIELSTDNWKSIFYLGCIASGAGFFLWNKSQTNPGTLAAFNNAVVPIAVLFSLFGSKKKRHRKPKLDPVNHWKYDDLHCSISFAAKELTIEKTRLIGSLEITIATR